MDRIYTIMIAEDEDMIRNSLKRNIEACELGFKIIGLAEDGKELLDLLKYKVPNVIITDIHMPVIDGLELAKIVDAQYPDVLKVVVSGFDKFEYAKKAIGANVQDYLLKPVIHQDMMKTLTKLRVKLDKIYGDTVEEFKINNTNQYSISDAIDLLEEYIKNNYTKNINFEILSEQFSFNMAYLSRNFSNKFGKSPSKYLINLRINKAKQLLINNIELNVREIGELVGYPEQPYFCRIFKNNVGVTPMQYRLEKDAT